MDLRHLRYFLAVADEGSLTVAAEKRLHTAQPSLSRQMRDLEVELGCVLMTRGVRGIKLTDAGRVFADHARAILLQVEAAMEATRRAATPAKASFVIGFLTGYEFNWLPAVMRIMQDALPTTEIVILSLSSPDLADGLTRGKIDLAFMRREKNAPGVVFTHLLDEPLIVLLPGGHALASKDAVTPADITGMPLIGVPHDKSPALRAVTDAYGAKLGIDLTPDHNVDKSIHGHDAGRFDGRYCAHATLRAQPAPNDCYQQTFGRRGAGDRPVAGLSRNEQLADLENDCSPDRRTEIPQRVGNDELRKVC